MPGAGPQCGSVPPRCWHHIRANQALCSVSVPSSISLFCTELGRRCKSQNLRGETDSYWPIDSRVKCRPIKLKGVEQISQSACKEKPNVKKPPRLNQRVKFELYFCIWAVVLSRRRIMTYDIVTTHESNHFLCSHCRFMDSVDWFDVVEISTTL